MRHALVFGLCLAAMAALALAMARHQETQCGRLLPPGASRGLRAGGWALLLAALGGAVAAPGWTLGLVAWIGHTSLAAGLVFCALLWRERWRSRAVPPGGVVTGRQPPASRHPG